MHNHYVVYFFLIEFTVKMSGSIVLNYPLTLKTEKFTKTKN